MTRAGVQSFRLTAVRALVCRRDYLSIQICVRTFFHESFFKGNDILKMPLLDIHFSLKNIHICT